MGTPTYIAVAGNIGCGKSTLTAFLCNTYGLEPFFEPNANNPYLESFYADMLAWSFHCQIYFLTHKFRIHKELEMERGQRTVVLDRTIYEDAEIFAHNLRLQGYISERDWGVYRDLYETLTLAIEPPDLMVYLRASVRTIKKRIAHRGRSEEQNIPTAYLRGLNDLYETWFQRYDRSPTLVIQTDDLDYVSDLEHRLDLIKAVEAYLTPGKTTGKVALNRIS